MPPRVRYRHWTFTIFTKDCPSQDAPEVQGDGFWDPFLVGFNEHSVRYVVAGLETCPDTGRVHWQGYISTHNPVGLATIKGILDCEWAHMEQAKGSPLENRAYCTKEDTAVGDQDGDKVTFEFGTLPPTKDKRNRDDSYREILGCKTFAEALVKAEEVVPRDFVLYKDAITRCLLSKFRESSFHLYPMQTFCRPPFDKFTLDKKSIVIYGMSNAAKTAYACAHFTKPLLVSHIDDLKLLMPDNDGVVFDDMCFSHYPPESCIHLVDLEYERSIHCRNVNARMPKGMHRMFTTNRDKNELFSVNANDEQKLAIERRCVYLKVHKSLIK